MIAAAVQDVVRGATPSVFRQGVDLAQVPAARLMASPRNFNASILAHEGRRWLAYRSHRLDQGGRCAIAIVELGRDGEPKGPNQWIDLPARTGREHHEDPRLFVYRGRVHLTFVETRFNVPNPYTCAIKYCRLKLAEGNKRKAAKWQVDSPIWQPQYGRNDGQHQEKNWQFFEHEGRLHAVYEIAPHRVIEIEGDRVVGETVADGRKVAWPWGVPRGGTPPVRLPSGHWLSFFHSATWHPYPPHWRRYYSGAYLFEGRPPWRVLAISHTPLLTGSAEDGHAKDPRNIDTWKPFVVFPCGLVVEPTGECLVSYGVNDHFIVLARHRDMALGQPDFSDWAPRYFRTDNATLPVRVYPDDRTQGWLHWQPVGAMVAGTRAGVLRAGNPRDAQVLEEAGEGVEEIDAATYRALGGLLK